MIGELVRAIIVIALALGTLAAIGKLLLCFVRALNDMDREREGD